MKFENTEIWGFKHAIRGARNPLESWAKSDSHYYSDIDFDCDECVLIGENDLGLMQRLIKASMKETNSHSKFLRQIMVSVDITAPLYWWKEFDTYKVGTVANSTSTMHKIQSKPITLDCFEIDDYNPNIASENTVTKGIKADYVLNILLPELEYLRLKYLETKDVRYWKELIRLLPESWLQTRTVTLNYQVLRQMYFDRRYHKLNEWSGRNNPDNENFVKWVKTLPYAEDLIMYEIKKPELTKLEKDTLIELICNEQTIHMIAKDKFETEKYVLLEQLKAKIREM